MSDTIAFGGVIIFSIRVDEKSDQEFNELEKLIRARKKLTAKDARIIAKIMQNGYVTQCGFEEGDEKSKTGITDYDLVARSTPKRF